MARLQSTIIFLLLLVVLWSPMTTEGGSALDFVRYVLFGLLGTGLIIVALLEGKAGARSLQIPTGPALIALFILYSAVSVFWSDGGMSSIIKAGLILIALGFSLAAASSKSNAELLRLLVAACAIFMTVGFFVALFVPSIGVETGWLLEGKWRGISGQKNGFGAIAAVCLVAALVLPGSGRGTLLFKVVALGFSALCLFLSGSRGAQMIAGIGIASLVFVRFPRRAQNLTLLVSLLLALPIVVLVISTFNTEGTVLSFAGLTFDTSNRTEIWAYGLESLTGREVFGFGLAGFWTPERLDLFRANHGWVLDNFHNGYVTILIEGGLFGIGFFVSGLVASFAMMRLMTVDGDRYAVFSFALFNMLVGHNLIENTFGRSTSFLFLSFLLVTFSAFRFGLRVGPARGRPAPPYNALPVN